MEDREHKVYKACVELQDELVQEVNQAKSDPEESRVQMAKMEKMGRLVCKVCLGQWE